MKRLKKLLIPIVALLAFSMLSTSVSANKPYYMASFYGEASGYCNVYDEWTPVTPIACGKGRAQIRGLAVTLKGSFRVSPFPIPPEPIFSYQALYVDPDTRVWTRRTHVTVSWNNKKLTVWMWPSTIYIAVFNDTEDTFGVWNLRFFGYYKGEAGLEFVGGIASVCSGFHPVVKASFLSVQLRRETGQQLTFMWVDRPVPVISAEYVAQSIIYGVTVWGPIPWHPSGP